MKLLIATLKDAWRGFFSKRWQVKIIKIYLKQIKEMVDKMAFEKPITFGDLEKRNKIIRQAILFSAFNQNKMKEAWSTKMDNQWRDNVMNDENTSKENKKSPEDDGRL